MERTDHDSEKYGLQRHRPKMLMRSWSTSYKLMVKIPAGSTILNP